MSQSRSPRSGRRLTALLGLTMAALAGPLAAHDFWLVPSSFRPAPGGPLAVRLKVGERLQGDVLPRDPAQIERFSLLGPLGGRGETPIAGPDGAEPAGYAHLGGPGLYWIVYDSAPNRLDLPADKFEEALKKEGLERISELRRARGESDRPSREVFSRCAKSLVRVGVGAPSAASTPPIPGVERPLGLDLELIPERDPSAPLAGGELPVKLLYRGKPLAGALVIALHPGKSGGDRGELAELSARTDRDGRVRLALPEAGFWLVKSVHMVPAQPGAGIDWESLWASLTFELPAR